MITRAKGMYPKDAICADGEHPKNCFIWCWCGEDHTEGGWFIILPGFIVFILAVILLIVVDQCRRACKRRAAESGDRQRALDAADKANAEDEGTPLFGGDRE